MDTALISAWYQESAALHAACRDTHPATIARIADLCIERIEAGGKLLLCGNGGSASMSLHFAAELVNKLVRYRHLLWGLSTSGSSANVVAAMHAARQRDMAIIAFTGKDGSPLACEADLAVTVAHTDTARIQEIHLCAGHAVCACIEQHYLDRENH